MDSNDDEGLKKPSEMGLGRSIYNTITNLTCDYVLYIFKFLDNEIHRNMLDDNKNTLTSGYASKLYILQINSTNIL